MEVVEMPQALAQCLIPIHLCRMRITRLDSLGNVFNGPNNSYVTDKPIDLKFKPVIEAGEEKTLKGGCACIVAQIKEPDLFKRCDFEFSDGAYEPAMIEMLSGSPVVLDTSTIPVPIGNMFPDNMACGDTGPPLSAIECWSDAFDVDHQDPTLPYFYFVWPATRWAWSDGALGAEFDTPAFAGYSVPNGQWNEGPYGYTHSVGQQGGYWYTASAPPAAACGYATVAPSS
jgi:hypothetical protein